MKNLNPLLATLIVILVGLAIVGLTSTNWIPYTTLGTIFGVVLFVIAAFVAFFAKTNLEMNIFWVAIFFIVVDGLLMLLLYNVL